MPSQQRPHLHVNADAPESTTALILCGGRSSRMQQDKNFVLWRGHSLLHHVIHQVRVVCCRVILVTAARDQPLPAGLPLDSLEVVVDSDPWSGPAAALAAGLQYLNSSSTLGDGTRVEPGSGTAETCVFLSGNDSPCLQPTVIQHLRERLHRSPSALAVVPRAAGDPTAVFPLCAVYSSRSQPLVANYVQRGGRSMRGLLDCLPVEWLEEPQLRQLDPDLRSLINLNTPADVAALDRLT